jgi:DNA-binding NtrC family response regulator
LGERARILVVDDEESIRKTVTAILEEEGYVVDTAKNGKEAISKSNAKFYNLALIDIRLPDMEGTKLLTAMKETTPPMIKIIVTGYPSLQNAVEAVNKGADAYVLKPFDVKKILRTIEEQLEKQQKARKYSEERITEFIETRVKELEAHETTRTNKS